MAVPRQPTPSAPDDGSAAGPPPGEAPPAPVLVLLSQRDASSALCEMLHASPGPVHVSRTANLTEAMVAVGGQPPVLAVVDALLCDALEREFVAHLLQSDAGTRVLLVDGRVDATWPHHPRLEHLALPQLLPAVGRWLAARAGVGCGREIRA